MNNKNKKKYPIPFWLRSICNHEYEDKVKTSIDRFGRVRHAKLCKHCGKPLYIE